jgi:hypothetical protein
MRSSWASSFQAAERDRGRWEARREKPQGPQSTGPVVHNPCYVWTPGALALPSEAPSGLHVWIKLWTMMSPSLMPVSPCAHRTPGTTVARRGRRPQERGLTEGAAQIVEALGAFVLSF